jgi:hypothetical protein
MSSPMSLSQLVNQVGQIGLSRTFGTWDNLKSERAKILDAHGRNMIPWVSFHSVGGKRGGWKAVASGRFDADIRARARHYASLNKPVIATFHHEPHGSMEGERRDWANAFIRIHQVMQSETGMKNVALAPIIGDWEFNPINKKADPHAFLSDGVLGRMAFLGTDLYQNQSGRSLATRLGYTMNWLDKRGFPNALVGLGETGATNRFGSPKAAAWWGDAWRFMSANRDRVVAVSYFNSSRHSKSWVYWPVDESADKLKAFRASVSDSVTIRLR